MLIENFSKEIEERSTKMLVTIYFNNDFKII